MMNKGPVKARPMNVVVAKGSQAEKFFAERRGLPGGEEAHPEVIVPGIPPRPAHDLRFHGGRTLKDLTFTNLYVGGTQSWNQSDIQNIDAALAAAMADADLNNVMMQYFGNQPITSTFKPSQILPGAKPAVVSQGDVENLVGQLRSDGRLKGFDLTSTLFNFVLPSGTVLNTNAAPTGGAAEWKATAESNPAEPESEVSSLQGLGGYHGSVHPTAGETIYYAVGVYSERRSDGTVNGIVAFDKPWKNVVATFYHELNEARTDADVEDAIKAGNDPNGSKFLGWMSRQGEECGDFPVAEVGRRLSLVMRQVLLTNGTGTVPVQFQYSNAVHGPEGPIAAPHSRPAVRARRLRSRRLRLLHEFRALRCRQVHLLRALRAFHTGRLRVLREEEAALFGGAEVKGPRARRRRLVREFHMVHAAKRHVLRALRRQELALLRLRVAAEESRLATGHPQAWQLSRPGNGK
jgi:hypothetical protein